MEPDQVEPGQMDPIDQADITGRSFQLDESQQNALYIPDIRVSPRA